MPGVVEVKIIIICSVMITRDCKVDAGFQHQPDVEEGPLVMGDAGPSMALEHYGRPAIRRIRVVTDGLIDETCHIPKVTPYKEQMPVKKRTAQ